jgi:anaerobic magnesium-protoporphyrin IX monomethyl ester cyclase
LPLFTEREKRSFADILDGRQLDSIRGIIFMDNNGKVVVTAPRDNIKELDAPSPAYELSKGISAERKIPIITSGHPHFCTYCSVNMVMGRGFRKRSPANVLAEIEHWYGLGYRLFSIGDDTFTSDTGRAERICELIIDKKLEIGWELRTGVRIDRVNEPLLRLMKKAGCYFLAYGIESIDDGVLGNEEGNYLQSD